jgi:predicted HicB family RNase H-like nuclease
MNNTLEYKGFRSRIDYSADDNLFVGRLIGIKDIVTFHGKTVNELRREMAATVDFYLDVCEKSGERAKKHYSGKVMLRVPNKLHEKIAEAAEAAGKSINEWGKEVLESAVK